MAEINAEYKNFNKLNEELAKKNIKLFYIFNYDFYLNEKSIFVVTHNDEVYCFGYNIHGFLGFGHQKQIKEFTLNEDLSNKQIIQFIQGECHVFARTLNGNIYCWGKNEYGYFGNGSADLERIHKPGINGYLLNEHIKDISSGLRHTLILTSMGEVYAFGRNSFGQIGNHHNEDVYIPFKLNGFNGEKIKTISCGYHYSMALTQDGHVYSWGKNDSGQLGIGHTENTNSPQLILLDKNIIIDKISCGYAHTLLLSRESDVYVFGSNIYFQLGIEITSNKHLFPIKLNNEIKFSDIALHSLYHFSSALTANGIYYVWGKCGNINSKHCIKVPKETTFKSFQELLNHYMELTPKTWFYQSGKFNKLYSHQTKLGEGDYGVVYKANYIVMDEYFAIKKIQLYNTGADDFMKEINTTINSIIDLKSEYLIQYYDIWLEMDFKIVKESRIWDNNQSFYIQMELCDKLLPDFNTEIKVDSKLYLNNIFTRMGFYILGQITFQILQGVEYLHRNNIIHRDLKPDNILLKNGRIKVADFGLAKLIDNSKPNILNTGDIGNLKYMAPEVELSEYYDTKADVYSLGVILQELFEMEINNSIQYNSDVILKRKYVNIEALTEKMVNENPLERPDLQQILSETEKWCIYENEFNFDKELANIPEDNYIQIIIRNIMSLKLYETYLGRFSTFKDWKNSYVKPEILAEKGFYFLGMDDRIKCVSCGNVWWGLDEGDQLKEFLHTSDCKYWRKSV